MGIFSKMRKRNPAHPSYWGNKVSKQVGWNSFNKKHKIYSEYPDPRYWVSPLDAVPYVGQVGKAGKIVKATQQVVKRRKMAVRYIKRTSRLVDSNMDRVRGKKTVKNAPNTSRKRRYGIDDYY